jgi:hypothetical protein
MVNGSPAALNTYYYYCLLLILLLLFIIIIIIIIINYYYNYYNELNKMILKECTYKFNTEFTERIE